MTTDMERLLELSDCEEAEYNAEVSLRDAENRAKGAKSELQQAEDKAAYVKREHALSPREEADVDAKLLRLRAQSTAAEQAVGPAREALERARAATVEARRRVQDKNAPKKGGRT